MIVDRLLHFTVTTKLVFTRKIFLENRPPTRNLCGSAIFNESMSSAV